MRGGGADPGAGREAGHRDGVAELPLCPGEYRCEGLVRHGANGPFDELPLSAVPVGGEDEPPAHGVGDLGVEVLAHDVQAQVEGGRAARRGEDAAVVDEEHVRFELHGRKPLPEEVGPLPVRGGPPPVEHPGLGEREGPAAEAHRAGAARVGPADGVRDGGPSRHVGVRPVGHDHGVRGVGRVESGHTGEREEAVRIGVPGAGEQSANS